MRVKCFISIILLCIVLPFAAAGSTLPTPTDMQVLSAVLAPYCHPSDTSFAVLSSEPYVPDDVHPGIDPDALAQARHNSKAMPQWPNELACSGVHIESKRHIDEAFKRKPKHPVDRIKIPWGGFYETYKGATGLLILSMPGYSAAGDTAWVYVSQGCGGFCGAVRVLTLRRIAGTWRVAGSQIVAIA